jgi:hypothetical protein
MAGSDEFDPNARCLSAGMPNMMSMTYGMEIHRFASPGVLENQITSVGIREVGSARLS